MSGWFKHKMDAGDDPFIHELMDKFGSDGYWVFFRTLELMRQNHNLKSPGNLDGTWTWFRAKFRLYRNSIKRILDFCDEKHKFAVHYEGERVYVKCYNFKEYMDRYTRRLLREKVDTISEKSGHPSVHNVDTHKKRLSIDTPIGHSMDTTNESLLRSLGSRIIKKWDNSRGKKK